MHAINSLLNIEVLMIHSVQIIRADSGIGTERNTKTKENIEKANSLSVAACVPRVNMLKTLGFFLISV